MALEFRDVTARALAALEGVRDPAMRVEKLVGDASSRTYYRVFEAGGRTTILMMMADDPLKSDEVVEGERPVRLPFLDVGEYLRRGGIPVPEVLDERLDAGALLLEDLGDVTLERALAGGADKGDLYGAAVSLLARIQAWTETSPEPGCAAFRRTFGEGLLAWELEHFREWLLEAWAGAAATPGQRQELDAFFGVLVRELVALPRGFVHRDYQSRNLMLCDGRLRVIDFQDALVGPWLYDLVALLRDSYVSFTPEEVESICRRFLAARAELGLAVPGYGDLMRGFHLQALQRKLKDAGRFVYIDRVKGNPRFLPSIPRSLGYAREAMDYLGEFPRAREVMAQLLPEHFG